MNGEKNCVPRAAAVDRVTLPSQARKFEPTLVVAQLWLFAAFGALSLVAIAFNSLASGEESIALPIILGMAGIALFPVMLHNVVRTLERADPNPETPVPLAPELRFALHR